MAVGILAISGAWGVRWGVRILAAGERPGRAPTASACRRGAKGRLPSFHGALRDILVWDGAMRIIGVSGVEGTMEFKRRHWPDLEEREYRISQGHDSAAALVVDGELQVGRGRGANQPAQAHRRLTRPARSRYSLAEAGIWRPATSTRSPIPSTTHPTERCNALDPISERAVSSDVLCPRGVQSRTRAARAAGVSPTGSTSSTSSIIWRMPPRALSYSSGWDECMVVVMDVHGRAQGVDLPTHGEGGLESPSDRISAPGLGRDSLLAGDTAPGLRLQLRRVQDHGPGSIRRSGAFSGRSSSGRSTVSRRVNPHPGPETEPHEGRTRKLHRYAPAPGGTPDRGAAAGSRDQTSTGCGGGAAGVPHPRCCTSAALRQLQDSGG